MTNLLQTLRALALLAFYSANAQEIFNYEKEIPNKENYLFQEIEFKALEKKDSITLSGTLFYPKGQFDKIVVIVPGSGADTRHSHYRLTEALLKDNVAVYRYDERGLGKSGGTFNTANYTISMMSAELKSAIKALQKNPVLNGKKLGLLGHSQGGMVTMGALEKNVPVDFLIQWATPVQKHGAFIEYQLRKGQNAFMEVLKFDTTEEKLAVMSALHKIVEENKEMEDWPLTKKLDKAGKKLGYTKKHYERFPYLTLASEKDIVRKDFESAYKGMSVPMLYIVGSLDTFVDPVAETELLESFRNPNITIRRMEGLHHYLGRGKLTLETLYDIDNAALLEITDWIKAQ